MWSPVKGVYHVDGGIVLNSVCSMSGVERQSGTLAGFNPHEPSCQAGKPYPGFLLFQKTFWWNTMGHKEKQ